MSIFDSACLATYLTSAPSAFNLSLSIHDRLGDIAASALTLLQL